MIVFDVDGTLVGGETTDWASFVEAFKEAAGFALDRAFFENLEEVTAQAIVHEGLRDLPLAEKKRIEHVVRAGYLQRLQAAHENDPATFPALEGALTLLAELKRQGVPVAIATGDWFETITFKLRAAGIPFEDIPVVTSSDFYSRRDIIAGAVTKAGKTLHETVYIGDGLWDFRACQKLGIPFIGVGYRKDKLERAGVAHTLNDLSPANFWNVLEIIWQTRLERPLPWPRPASPVEKLSPA